MNTARGFAAFPPRPGRRGRSWWARAFVAAMEDTALDAVLLRRGRRFAGSGRVGPITISPGRISAVVEDPDGIVEVTVHLTQLTDADWDRLLDQVGAEAGGAPGRAAGGGRAPGRAPSRRYTTARCPARSCTQPTPSACPCCPRSATSSPTATAPTSA